MRRMCRARDQGMQEYYLFDKLPRRQRVVPRRRTLTKMLKYWLLGTSPWWVTVGAAAIGAAVGVLAWWRA